MTMLRARAAAIATLERRVEAWRAGTGGVVFIAGEAGMGKSALLDVVERTLASETVVRVDCRPPVGSINVSAIQPLQPFGAAIEKLFLRSGQAARKRLALNIGMSVLASIPIAGDLFYAVKAISQDVNEYKRETAALQEKRRSAVAECIQTLRTIVERTPFVLLVDDAQWSDTQSIEVLRQLASGLADTPLLIICALAPDAAQRHNLPLATLLRTDDVRAATIHLEPVGLDDTQTVMEGVIAGVNVPAAVLSTVFERSGGNPGVIAEYARFLQGAGHIRPDGSVDDHAFDTVRLTSGDHPATDVVLRDISDDDATVLSLCAAEGREFTAFLQAALGNTDVLTMIRTLRRLQQTTGLIRSMGVRTRYGVKTTSYEFTQTFPYTYFLHRPEYEERKSIHQRIAEILGREFATTRIDELRSELAVHIAAHGAEAEDDATVERMLTMSADAADRTGSPEIAHIIRVDMLPSYQGGMLTSTDVDEDDAGTSGASGTPFTPVPMNVLVRELTDAIVQGRPADARTAGIRTLETNAGLSRHERILLTCLVARACIELSMLDDAESYLRTITALPDVAPSDLCTIRNVEAALAMARLDHDAAGTLLRDAARIAEALPVHLRVLTLGNIIVHLRAMNDLSADRYEQTVRRLVTTHGWPGVRADLGL
jgi:hypothetical protein